MVARVSAGIATSDPRATAAGAQLLKEGATAADAAVAAALVLYVVEPQSCGPGGDAFMLHFEPGRDPVGLDGSGALPAALDDAALTAAGLDTIPARGAASATVPGAMRLLEDAVAKFGTRSMAELAEPALGLAARGFEVRPTLANAAARAAAEIGDDSVLGPLYVPDGVPVAAGDTVVNSVLAECLADICENGSTVLHQGALGRAVVDRLRADGGFLTEEDFAAHTTTPIRLVATTFRGRIVWELSPPTQGVSVIYALDAIQREFDAVESPDHWMRVIELMGEAMATAGFDLSQIGARPAPAQGDTTYIAAVDHHGGAASLITSLFGDFGAHLGIPELGGPIGNRATMLRALRLPMMPGRKPPHTTIPAAVTRDGELQIVLGVAGGFMQPQAQVQILIHMLERGLDPQTAIDAPRFRIGFGGALALERGHPLSDALPEAANRPPGPEGFGAAQVIAVDEHGHIAAGADPRRGGSAQVIN
jgi:gamma-glutamyltranspeptidase/glutathione hydrolase